MILVSKVLSTRITVYGCLYFICEMATGPTRFCLRYREAALIVYDSRLTFRPIKGDVADNTAINFGFEAFVDCRSIKACFL